MHIEVKSGTNCQEVQSVCVTQKEDGIYYVSITTKSKYVDIRHGFNYKGQRGIESLIFFVGKQGWKKYEDVDEIEIHFEAKGYTLATIEKKNGIDALLIRRDKISYIDVVASWNRYSHIGSTLDSFLEEEGILEEVNQKAKEKLNDK